MKKTPDCLLERARHLRSMGLSFREIAQRTPGITRSVAHRAARSVPILVRNGKGWPNRLGWAYLDKPARVSALEWGRRLNSALGKPEGAQSPPHRRPLTKQRKTASPLG